MSTTGNDATRNVILTSQLSVADEASGIRIIVTSVDGAARSNRRALGRPPHEADTHTPNQIMKTQFFWLVAFACRSELIFVRTGIACSLCNSKLNVLRIL